MAWSRSIRNCVKIRDALVAFLNYREGGLIYIGIDKTGSVIGVDNPDSLQLKVKDRLKNNIRPSCLGLFDIILEEYEGEDVIKIIVASGPEKPYHLRKYGMSEKGTFIRTGSATEPLPIKWIEKYFAKRTRHSLGKIRANRQKLRFQQLKIYYEESGKLLNNQFANNLELLTEDQKYNYVGYLMADENSISIKVAGYNGTNRIHLEENNEYGYCSLIKATKSVLDKVEVINRTISKITSRERIDKRLWDPVALREAIINAIVHTDYTREIPPKFEFFSDRIEITSAGGLPENLSQSEFFEGYSVPRNQEIMRIFKDLELVEHLGSGIPRILRSYGRESFQFSDNFLRMVFPSTEQVTEQVRKLLEVVDSDSEYITSDLMELVEIKHRPTFLYNYIRPALKAGLIEMTIPDKPQSRLQKYRMTNMGESIKSNIPGE